jgi:hypothetical protein
MIPEQSKQKPTNGKANRKRGHTYEVSVASFFRKFFPHIITSRAGNKRLDAAGIDLCNKDEIDHGRLPVSIQCKNCTEQPPIHKLMTRMKGFPFPMIFWAYVVRNEQGHVTRVGEYVVMKADDFKELFTEAHKELCQQEPSTS